MSSGLIVMRAQPLHMGHTRTINVALLNSEKVVIVLGSVQEHGTSQNPFMFSERKRMIKNFYTELGAWDKIFVVGLKDIFSLEWPNYVLREIAKQYPDMTLDTVYGGSDYDCNWFHNKLNPYIVNRNDTNFEYVSATMVREMLMYGDPRWMRYVPECNWGIVAKKFNRLEMLKG